MIYLAEIMSFRALLQSLSFSRFQRQLPPGGSLLPPSASSAKYIKYKVVLYAIFSSYAFILCAVNAESGQRITSTDVLSSAWITMMNISCSGLVIIVP